MIPIAGLTLNLVYETSLLIEYAVITDEVLPDFVWNYQILNGTIRFCMEYFVYFSTKVHTVGYEETAERTNFLKVSLNVPKGITVLFDVVVVDIDVLLMLGVGEGLLFMADTICCRVFTA